MNLATKTSIQDSLLCLELAHQAALAATPDRFKNEEWQLRFSTVSESRRWEILYYKYDFDETLYDLWKITEAIAGLSTLLSTDKIAEAQRPVDLSLGTFRPGQQGAGK